MRPFLNSSAIKLDWLRLLLSSNPLRLSSASSRRVTFRNFWSPTKSLIRTRTRTETPPGFLLCCRAPMGTSPGAVVEVKEKIELTEIEKKIFDRLLNTLHHFNLKTELRVAGGWVRDKVCLSLKINPFLYYVCMCHLYMYVD